MRWKVYNMILVYFPNKSSTHSDFFRYKTDSGFRSRSQWQIVSFFPKCMVQNSQSEKVSQSGSQLQP